MKATSDDDKPVPGFLYQEINKITHESAENCESCLEFLVDRLNRDTCHVKLKTLKVMKYIVEHGHPNFKLGLIKNSKGIKEATKFSGPPDPLHGNTPYVMVRKNAQSLSEVLFNTETTMTDETQLQTTPPRMVGLGPKTSTPQGPERTRMEGFGNTPTSQNKSFGENIKEGLFKMAEKLGETTHDHQRELLSTIETSGSYRPPAMTASYTPTDIPKPESYTSQQTVKSKTVSPPKHVPGKAGGGWDDDDLEEVQGHTRSSDSGSAGLADRLESATLEDCQAEDNLVTGYINSTASPLLKRSQLKAFVKDCSGLNCDKIVEILSNKLGTSEDHSVMRCLLLLETLISSDLVNLEALTSVCRENLVKVYYSQQSPAQSKARKLVRILEKLTSHTSILPIKSCDKLLVDVEPQSREELH